MLLFLPLKRNEVSPEFGPFCLAVFFFAGCLVVFIATILRQYKLVT